MSNSLGRPLLYDYETEPLKPYSARLTDYHRRLAKRFGKGNASAGIRIALEHYKANPPQQKGAKP